MSTPTIRPLASLVRILLLMIIFGGVVGLFMWRGLLDREHELLDEISRIEHEMAVEVAAREEMIDRLARTHRLARVEIMEQATLDSGQVETTFLRFIELDDDGSELGRRDFEIPGDVLFVDAWTVRFDTEHVANGDPFAGQTLVLFRRIYSDRVQPKDGIPIDTPGGIPDGYAVTEQARFERALWRRFWRIATDHELARSMGVRVAQGEAVYKPVRPGQAYDLVAEASGGLTLVPLGDQEPEDRVAAVSSKP